MKKLILLLITLALLIIIYKITYKSNKLIFIIGDGIAKGVYDKEINYNFVDHLNTTDLNIQSYLQVNYRLKDLTTSIKENTQYKSSITFQNVIKNSSQIILFIGPEEINNQLSNKIDKNEIENQYILNYQELIKELIKYQKNISIIGLYQIKGIDYQKINKKIQNLCQQYSLNYISIENIPTKTNNRLSYEDHKLIFNIVLDSLNRQN